MNVQKILKTIQKILFVETSFKTLSTFFDRNPNFIPASHEEKMPTR